MLSTKTIANSCFNKTNQISILRDILGVYANDNPQRRSLKDRLNQSQDISHIKLAIVSIQGASPTIQRDLDNTNVVIANSCGTFLYPTGHQIITDRPHLNALDQDSCPLGVQSNPTDEEDELFDLGRDMGANIVAYYITNGPSAVGCSAYPAGRRGFWVDDGASPWTFAHELVHVIGLNQHQSNSDNLMSTPTASITNLPPDMTTSQCNNFNADTDIESC